MIVFRLIFCLSLIILKISLVVLIISNHCDFELYFVSIEVREKKKFKY